MPMLNPDGSQIYGLVDPNTYCMTPEQIGEILAAAFMKVNEAFVSALLFYMMISLIIGFTLGCGLMYLYCRSKSEGPREAEE